MIAQYTPVDKEVTIYGIDFFDANGNLVLDQEFGTNKAAWEAAVESPDWPETAVRTQPYTQQAIATRWESVYSNSYRDSLGRFQTRGHYE
ncbi:MAG: hypothetical protein KC413_07855 [Anaerolineales bacterium]|nr:hypothetical protein [Anaerolineales bacterium]